ncbi:MAG: hypothetical protein E6H38_07470 [Betaproteobacteria bacterium]|nr:MAG: hypothetical protein E6H38_07470 [Betaproteobacteria bacterium]
MRFALEELVLVHFEHLPVDLVHGEEAGGHPAGAGEELAAADVELPARLAGDLLDARLDLLLVLGLRDGHVLAVRHHLRRNRRMEQVRLVCPGQFRQLLVAQPDIGFAVTSNCHDTPPI